MEVKLESVTPEKAEAWLNKNNNNRTLRDGVAELYAKDMKNGKWTQCAAPIAFYDDGDLADGQHRLWAIIESNTTQRFPVVRGLNRQDGLNIDTGLGRTIVDNGRISGLDTELSCTLVAAARATELGAVTTSRQSNADKLEVVAKHREACAWAIANLPFTKNIRNAVTLGAISRAYYCEPDHEKLARYCQVLATGFAEGEHESAAVAMRNYLLTKGALVTHHTLWRDTFLKVQSSIANFMKGRKLTVIRGVADETYPLKKVRRKNPNVGMLS